MDLHCMVHNLSLDGGGGGRRGGGGGGGNPVFVYVT